MRKGKIVGILVVLVSIYLLLNQIEAYTNISISTANKIEYTVSGPIEITSDQDFIDLGFSGSGTKEDPYIIENYDISGINTKEGIYVADTTRYFIIRDCKITGAKHGIGIENITYETAQIIDNYLYLNDENGIDLYDTSGHLIRNNTLVENKMGLRFDECNDLTIIENAFENNRGCGFVTFNSDNLYISENLIFYSDYKGITCETTTNSTFYKNLFKNNDEFGISLTSRCAGNIIYHNDFIENNQDPTVPEGTTQGDDRSANNNTWYNEALSEGNFWTDHLGETYLINGAANCCDLYPLEEPKIYDPATHDQNTDDIDTDETNYSLLFFLIIISTSFVLQKRRKGN